MIEYLLAAVIVWLTGARIWLGQLEMVLYRPGVAR